MLAEALVERGERKAQIFYLKDFNTFLKFFGYRVKSEGMETRQTVEQVIGRPLYPTVYDELYVETNTGTHRNQVLTNEIGEGEVSKFRSWGAVEYFLLGERQFMATPLGATDLYADRPHRRVHIRIPPTKMINRHFPNGAYLTAFKKVSEEKTRGAATGETKIEYSGFIRDAFPAFYIYCINHGFPIAQELVIYHSKVSLADKIPGK